MHAIRLLCPRALLFRQGRLELGGPSEEVIARHHELLSVDATAGTDESSGAGASLVERTLVDATGAVAHHPRQGDHLTSRARLRFHHDLYYRITVLELHVPPLPDHPAALPLPAEPTPTPPPP